MACTPPAVKLALLALFQAHTWPTTPPEIRWGGPTESEDQPRGGELVYFADILEYEETHPTLGAPRVDETYMLRIHIDVQWDGDDEQSAELRMWALYESLRRLLWQQHNLIADPGEMTVRLEDRVPVPTNVALPSGWVSRMRVDQAVVGLVFNP